VIVDNLNVPCLAVFPDEADSPLIVDPNAVLPGPGAPERFQTVAGRNPQIREPLGRMEIQQPSPRHTFDRNEPENLPIQEQRLGIPGSK
jgi:hypothetical protein